MDRNPEPGYGNNGQRCWTKVQEQKTETLKQDTEIRTEILKQGTELLDRDPETGYGNNGQRSWTRVREQWTEILNQGTGLMDIDPKQGCIGTMGIYSVKHILKVTWPGYRNNGLENPRITNEDLLNRSRCNAVQCTHLWKNKELYVNFRFCKKKIKQRVQFGARHTGYYR
jgi:hypothetical protein